MKKKFNIECEMEERWINYFASFLKNMEANGVIGHSEILGFYSDGDGDFRPKFDFDIDIKKEKPYNYNINDKINIFDAG